jgi:hypothetical protein
VERGVRGYTRSGTVFLLHRRQVLSAYYLVEGGSEVRGQV